MSAELSWTIRRAVADDAAALSLVASATFLEAFAGVLAGPDIVAHCASAASADAFTKWIADPAYGVTIAEAGNGAAPLAYNRPIGISPIGSLKSIGLAHADTHLIRMSYPVPTLSSTTTEKVERSPSIRREATGGTVLAKSAGMAINRQRMCPSYHKRTRPLMGRKRMLPLSYTTRLCDRRVAL